MKVWYSCRNHYADGILNSRWSTQGRMQCWCVDPTEPNFVFVFFGSATCCCNFGCEYSFFMLPYCSWTSAAKPEKMEDLRGARSKVGSCNSALCTHTFKVLHSEPCRSYVVCSVTACWQLWWAKRSPAGVMFPCSSGSLLNPSTFCLSQPDNEAMESTGKIFVAFSWNAEIIS